MRYGQQHLVLLSHYPLNEGRSMAAYRQLLAAGAEALGYRVILRTAPVRFGQLAWCRGGNAAKWLGYLDQFVLFPLLLWWDQQRWPAGTILVVSDQALGPWVPWIRRFRHLVICHDLLALEASRGVFPQQPVGLSGRLYQQWIRWGFRQGRRFAAVSEASRLALARELKPGHAPIELLPNPLAASFSPLSKDCCQLHLQQLKPRLSEQPYLLHVGGYWYKNREGVCAIFAALKQRHPQLQLVLVGHLERPAQDWIKAHPGLAEAIHQVQNLDQASLQALYCGAEVLLFPSWMEGFGWPVLEALACGCAVITTGLPPMSEVGGDAAVYIPACPQEQQAQTAWVQEAAALVDSVLRRSEPEKQRWRERGLAQAERFSQERWQIRLEQILQAV